MTDNKNTLKGFLKGMYGEKLEPENLKVIHDFVYQKIDDIKKHNCELEKVLIEHQIFGALLICQKLGLIKECEIYLDSVFETRTGNNINFISLTPEESKALGEDLLNGIILNYSSDIPDNVLIADLNIYKKLTGRKLDLHTVKALLGAK